MGDNGSQEHSELRSAFNRLSAVTASQEQLSRDVEKVQTQVYSLLILAVYGIGLSFGIYLSVRGIAKAVAK